jgi:fermentation-respiration switch protein FrsA (DUF1100 family)
MGGYGVLTEAAGGFDPAGVAARLLPGPYIGPYLPGGARRGEAEISGIKAVVAISPFTQTPAAPAWSPATLGQVKTPLLLIVGDQDRTVGFAGVKAVFDQATHSARRLLVFREGGHSIGMNPAVETDRANLWGQDWFEDPVWRKDRIIGVQLHFITAFLDRYVKGDATRDAYLDVADPLSDHGAWPSGAGGGYAAYSPGAAPITVWKGFQRAHDTGLELWKGNVAP